MRFLTLVSASLVAISLAAALPLSNTALHRRVDRNAIADRSAAELRAEEDLRHAILESSKVVKTKAKGKRPVPKKKPLRNSFETPKPVEQMVEIQPAGPLVTPPTEVVQTEVVQPTAAEIEEIEARKAAFRSRIEYNAQRYTEWRGRMRARPEDYTSVGPYEVEASELYKQNNYKVVEYTEAHFGDVDYMERAMAIMNNPDFGGNVELERIYRSLFLPAGRNLDFPDMVMFPANIWAYAQANQVNGPADVNANPDPQAEIESVLPGEFPAEIINPHATIEVPQMKQAEIEAADVAESVERQLGNFISHL